MSTQVQQRVTVASWDDDATAGYHDAAWTAWLHGSVGTLHRAGQRTAEGLRQTVRLGSGTRDESSDQVLLVVPMAVLTPAAIALALRLYKLGAISRLD